MPATSTPAPFADLAVAWQLEAAARGDQAAVDAFELLLQEDEHVDREVALRLLRELPDDEDQPYRSR